MVCLRPSVLGLDHDDAAHGVGAVIRRALHAIVDEDREDGLRLDGVERVEVRHANAIEHDHRCLIEHEARPATPTHARGMSVAVLLQREHRGALLQRLPGRLSAPLLDLLGGDQERAGGEPLGAVLVNRRAASEQHNDERRGKRLHEGLPFQPYTHAARYERQGIARARARVSSRAMLQLTALLLVAQIQVPPPRGYVNDFAGVLDAASVAHMDAVIAEVRDKTRGEIAVVTLPDIDDRSAADVALQIGRQWGVGAKGEAGDPTKNLGVVVLLVPQKNHRPGTGQIFIATGRGAEGFLPDARVGRIRDAMTPYLARQAYGAGLAYGLDLVAKAFAQEFGVTLTGAPAPGPKDGSERLPIPVTWIIVFVIVLIVLSRGRILLLPLRFGGLGGGGRGWSGGGGFGGGGFGGFGGGGGFSGGVAGGRF